MKRSIWTGKKSDDLIEVTVPGMNRFGGATGLETHFVEAEHEKEFREFMAFAQRNAKKFLLLVLGSSGLATLGGMLSVVWKESLWVCVAAIMVAGVTILIYPFATPETVAMMGIRRSRTLARVGGIIVLALTIFMALVATRLT